MQPAKLEQVSLEVNELAARMIDLPRGIVPGSATALTAGIDLGKYLAHWIVVAWSSQATGHIIDYGRIEVASEGLGIEHTLMIALREFKDLILAGWPTARSGGQRVFPQLVFIDAGYMTPVVYAFCRETGQRFAAAVGRGAAQQHAQWYNRPTQTGSIVRHIGEGYHCNWVPAEQQYLTEIDADHWKTWVHQRLSSPVGSPGAMSPFQASPHEHLSLAKHLTAEAKTEEFIAGKGVVTKWDRLRR